MRPFYQSVEIVHRVELLLLRTLSVGFFLPEKKGENKSCSQVLYMKTNTHLANASFVVILDFA